MTDKELKDPFGGAEAFLDFVDTRDSSLQALRLVNGTKGRFYLNDRARQVAWNQDFSKLSWSDVYYTIGLGGNYQLTMYECGEENLRFPQVGFNEEFIRWLCDISPEEPFWQYEAAVFYVYAGHAALNALQMDKHPELAAMIDHIITNTPDSQRLQEMWQKLSPDVPLPSDDGWERMGLEEHLSGLAAKYQHFLGSEDDAKAQAQLEALTVTEKGMMESPETLIAIGLQDMLIPYLAKATMNKMTDAVRKEHPVRDRLWREAVKERNPKSDIERKQLSQEVNRQYEELPPHKKMECVSLDEEREGEDGGTSSLADLIADRGESGFDEDERRLTLDAIATRAKLTKRQQLVFDMKREDREDTEIALALKERFGKPSSQGNVRKLHHDAMIRLRQAASELPPEERDAMLSLLT
ncbi:MAG: hypothetical protein V3R87_05450 [Dehalococcoidia bacterium]